MKKNKFKIIFFFIIISCFLSSMALAETRTATFDSIISGTNLSNYTENGLNITIPTYAYVAYYGDYFPSIPPNHPGFSGGFFYPSSGYNAPIVIETVDDVDIYDIKFNAGSGWTGDEYAYLKWDIWDNGSIVSSDRINVLKGTQVDIQYQSGFDFIQLYGLISSTDTSSYNALALDNLFVETSPGQTYPTPEPTSMLLLGFGLLGLTRVRRKFRK
jgi:hypothetical protein